MTEHHDHHHGDREQGAHGVPPPPDDATLEEYQHVGTRGAETVPLHFFAGPGPMGVRPIRRRYVKLRNGSYQRCEWEFRWYLDAVRGTGKREALNAIYDVLLAANSWTRAGVHWKRVMQREDADILVRVIPQDETVCGPGAAGCYSWGHPHAPVAEMGVEYINRPGPFAALTNMELLGHGTFRADDMYFAVHLPYVGVMGNWEAMARAGYMPTEQEVADSVTWVKGETDPSRIHWH